MTKTNAGLALGLVGVVLAAVFWAFPRSSGDDFGPIVGAADLAPLSADAGEWQCGADARPEPLVDDGLSNLSRSSAGLVMQLEVLNASCDAGTSYRPSIGLLVDEVAQVQLWYGFYPDDPEATPTSEPFSVLFHTEHDDGVASVVATVVVAGEELRSEVAVPLSVDRAELALVPEGTYWRHQSDDGSGSWVTDSLPDRRPGEILEMPTVVAGDDGAGSIAVQYRSVVPAASVNGYGREPGATDWRREVSASAGAIVDVKFEVANKGNLDLSELAVVVGLTPGLRYVEGSLRSDSAPIDDAGLVQAIDDALRSRLEDPVRLRGLDVGAAASLYFTVEVVGDVDPARDFEAVVAAFDSQEQTTIYSSVAIHVVG